MVDFRAGQKEGVNKNSRNESPFFGKCETEEAECSPVVTFLLSPWPCPANKPAHQSDAVSLCRPSPPATAVTQTRGLGMSWDGAQDLEPPFPECPHQAEMQAQ